jgi:hypothetical protein
MKKKVKKYAGGGLSGIASEATSLMGAADIAANAINSIKGGSGGGQGPIGGPDALGFLNNSNQSGPQPAYDPKAQAQALRSGNRNPDMYNQILTQQKNFFSQLANLANAGKPASFKKGGKVSSASKRADGIAIRGKTRA